MAKRNIENTSGSDNAKVRVFFAEVEGNNESVQEALKTMVSAMNRPVRVVSAPKINGKSNALLAQPDLEEVEETLDQFEEAEPLAEDAEAAVARKPRGTGKKVDRNAGLSLVPDLDFRPSGKQSFKDFIEKKSPENNEEMSLATVHYMQHVMGLNKITSSHVLSGFREAGKPSPVDLRQTIRNAKKTKMWLNFSDVDDLRTTTQGDNFVEHEMGESSSG